MNITLPEFSLVILIGASGAGKSSFAAKHFKPTEVISSDACRAAISDDENDLSVTKGAFELVRTIAAKRLEHRRLTVIDATSVRREDRQTLLALARTYHCLATAIVFNLSEKLCLERNAQRPERDFGPHVMRNQTRQLKRSLKGLGREGFRYVHVLNSPEEVETVRLTRQPLWTNKQHEHGPFDIVGDVHGCCDELETLLGQLGYRWNETTNLYPRLYAHPEGRKAIFLGGLMDRGPRNLDSYGLVRAMVTAGHALCVPGNHDVKLLKKLRGKQVKLTYGLEKTVAELEALPEEVRPAFEREMAGFIDGLVSHYVLDDGKLVVAHAGLSENLQGRASSAVRSFALFGDTTGETDAYGLPVRRNWAADYRGEAFVVYGHTPVAEPLHLNKTVNIDTGCVFGGALTALRYPEMTTVSVPAQEVYTEPARPLVSPADQGAERQGDALNIEDVLGKRQISTRWRTVTVRKENSAAALEVMSRAALNPRWLIYLPPTMAAPQTTQQTTSQNSEREGLLEHPDEAFAFYRREGVQEVLCQEKHMGSRIILVLCRNEEIAARRFGVSDGRNGVFYTRTGRPFFSKTALETALLNQVRTSLDETGFWDDFRTDWLCLDAELMPWSAKAQRLLETQYAAVGTAARRALGETLATLERAAGRELDVSSLQEAMQKRSESVAHYTAAYRRYCWPVTSVHDLKLAPFHLLATQGAVHTDKTHRWQMETLAKYLRGPSLQSTNYIEVNLEDEVSVAEGIRWWETLTAQGGEGMVVKPPNFIYEGKRGPVQPAVKVRGKEYLRLIYGPEYALPQHLEQLKARNVSAKRSLALREFLLGMEGLERFVRGEPFYRVHECVFGVLALESEPVDPRL